MKVLALDIATTTGWALLDGAIRTGLWVLAGTRGERCEQLDARLVWAVGEWRPDIVAFEEVMFHRGGRTGLLLGGLQVTVERVCERLRMPYVSVNTQTLKVFATGTGKAKKPAMIAAAKEATGLDLDEHEADAYWTARWALEHVEMEVE
jgi:Holliday junction resolvasome RuvABC endonuclease subunit